MESLFKTWETSRKLYLKFFDDYSLDQLNKVPVGFNNNLIWNIGHIIVAQQSLIYNLSDLDGYLPESLVELYKPGTKPTGLTTQAECDELKGLLTSLIDQTKADFHALGSLKGVNALTIIKGMKKLKNSLLDICISLIVPAGEDTSRGVDSFSDLLYSSHNTRDRSQNHQPGFRCEFISERTSLWITGTRSI